MNNNPLRFNDPTGHCAGYDYHPRLNDEQRLAECITRLQSEYDIDLTGEWAYDDLVSLQHGLMDLVDFFGGINYFKNAMGNQMVTLEYAGFIHQTDYASADKFTDNKITFYLDMFNSQDLARFVIIHEFTHLWDYNFTTQFMEDYNLGIAGSIFAFFTSALSLGF